MRENENKEEVLWVAQEGSQRRFLACPIREVLYEGTRGPGKTDALLMDFVSDTGKGFGQDWKGILFRRSYKELSDVISKSKKWFTKMKYAPTYNESKSEWLWPGGEKLMFRHMRVAEDYWKYHGSELQWVAFEELTTWPTDEAYKRIQSCMRSANSEVAPLIRLRATTNPYGIGHNWVKDRFQLPAMRNKVLTNLVDEFGKPLPDRMSIHGSIVENKILLDSDPSYIDNLRASARNESERKAWIEGSWDIVAGGMFDDVWNPKYQIIPRFTIDKVPRGWRIDRSFDWGSSKPFSVGWWLESNGEPMVLDNVEYGSVPGDLIRFEEWYGWSGRKANEGTRMAAADVADGIMDRERDLGIAGRCLPGPADSSIWAVENGKSIYLDMVRRGCDWTKANKVAGSRINGWEVVRQRFKNALPDPDGTREEPGLFVSSACVNFIRTVPVLPRSDRNLDDVDTDSEDHIADEVRYRLTTKRNTLSIRSF